ncbi:MAG: hypothetical protein M4579_001005 [Chaenotheca gracillima]|nr:MAG: hypothetical protein M4579_001005 [Chaenotheca gracillima]
MARKKDIAPMVNWVYDLSLWLFSILVDLFFREVHPRGAWKIPRRGPVMFVAAPHANQFVDPLILMRSVRMESHRRIAFLNAEKSMRRKFIGAFSRLVGAVPVGRALDSMISGPGTIYLPDPESDPTLLRGAGTNFESSIVQVGGLIVLPSINNATANAEILEIHGPEEIRLKRPFKGSDAVKQLTGRDNIEDALDDATEIKRNKVGGFAGSAYKIAPKVDQTAVYDAVFERLNSGGCVGIFPEGGSHDRTDLLPLKAGVAIMALGALAANPDCGLKIIPCGMNYFHAHKFRSRAVIEFGSPIEVPPELVEMYNKRDTKRDAIQRLLEIVYQSLVAVTVTSPDYDTLMVVQAARRLYNPTGKKLPLPMVVELNRRLVKGYTQYRDDPRIVHLKKSVNSYNKELRLLGIRDHQVQYAQWSVPRILFTLFYRLGKILVMASGTLPGLVLFSPVFIATKVISIKKSREALAASTVKIQGRDVMATWKLLVALGFAPILYAFYIILFTWLTYRHRAWGFVPEWVPLWSIVPIGCIVFPSITFAALRFGETGMDILKSIRPLLLALNPTSSNTFVKLRARRATLSSEVTNAINTLGPEMFPDFDAARIVTDPFREGAVSSPTSFTPPRSGVARRDSDALSNDLSPPQTPTSAATPPGPSNGASIGGGSSAQGHLPRNESFGNLGSIGLFATRPPSRSRSRSSSSGGLAGSTGFPVQGFSSLDRAGGFDEIANKIRGAMKERGQGRTRALTAENDASRSDSGAATPGSEDGKKFL